MGLFVLEVMSAVVWVLAAPGGPRESFSLIKLFSSLRIVLAGCFGLFSYRYHSQYPKALLHPRVLFRLLKAKYGIEALAWRNAFTTIEAVLDSLLFIAIVSTSWFIHNYVQERKDAEKQAAGSGAAAADGAGVALPAGKRTTPRGSAAKKRA